MYHRSKGYAYNNHILMEYVPFPPLVRLVRPANTSYYEKIIMISLNHTRCHYRTTSCNGRIGSFSRPGTSYYL